MPRKLEQTFHHSGDSDSKRQSGLPSLSTTRSRKSTHWPLSYVASRVVDSVILSCRAHVRRACHLVLSETDISVMPR